ncbi:MAG: hypothetical protein PSY14_16395 [bacterium]|nr:hypothetical protein [bacterium]
MPTIAIPSLAGKLLEKSGVSYVLDQNALQKMKALARWKNEGGKITSQASKSTTGINKMKNLVASASLALGIIFIGPAIAAEKVTPTKTDIESRYQTCIGPIGCSVQDSIGLLTELNTKSSRNLKRINEFCSEMNYTNCLFLQKNEIEQWHQTHEHMSLLMAKIASGSSGNSQLYADTKMK